MLRFEAVVDGYGAHIVEQHALELRIRVDQPPDLRQAFFVDERLIALIGPDFPYLMRCGGYFPCNFVRSLVVGGNARSGHHDVRNTPAAGHARRC